MKQKNKDQSDSYAIVFVAISIDRMEGFHESFEQRLRLLIIYCTFHAFIKWKSPENDAQMSSRQKLLIKSVFCCITKQVNRLDGKRFLQSLQLKQSLRSQVLI